ncbi:MAG: deoxyribonuclease IV [Chitinophagales bacterium]|nr:deoxyribonuclease IV [Chitinophagales bacterium]
MADLLLGVHCSISGGLHNAFDEANQLGVDTFQIFTKNQRQWRDKKISAYEKKEFSDAFDSSAIKTVVSHTTYLINLASGKDDLRSKSEASLISEVERCTDLGVAYAVLHPGAAKDLGYDKGMEQIAMGLRNVLKATRDSNVMILLENTAGQGSSIGYDFNHLRTIMDQVDSDRIGVCFDTCHAFAAGYDIRSKEGYDDTFGQFDEIVGLEHLKVLHLNDSKGDLGSKLDRHDNIGFGNIGAEAFGRIMNDFKHLPKVLETPKKDDWDSKNLEMLRSMVNN